ncbi:hypothetical protein [Pseudoalteromonas sp.]|uniref:hypothetical protein n=1 Tax=Pseudoalteromonas sp. TaxID=53249 RepID=UPI00260764EC|nr:hypothetical protein [Pseudoalteromonas sp.]MCP4589014.1 hypothetical protein [Pseudoalteromonas sp.]
MNIFTVLDVTSNNPDMPVISAADVEYIFPYEKDAYGHWAFGNIQPLVSKVSDKGLTEQSVSPVYSENYLTLSGDGKSLLSDFADSNINCTIATVFKVDSYSDVPVIFGSLGPTSSGGGGIYMFTNTEDQTGSLFANYRGTNLGNTPIATGLSANTWYFLALSREVIDETGKIGLKVKVNEIASVSRNQTNAGLYQPNESIACGQAFYGTSQGAITDFAEFIIFDKALTIDELNSLYFRSKSRMAKLGINI